MFQEDTGADPNADCGEHSDDRTEQDKTTAEIVPQAGLSHLYKEHDWKCDLEVEAITDGNKVLIQNANPAQGIPQKDDQKNRRSGIYAVEKTFQGMIPPKYRV